MGAMLGVPSSFRVEIKATGVPKYRIVGSIVLCMKRIWRNYGGARYPLLAAKLRWRPETGEWLPRGYALCTRECVRESHTLKSLHSLPEFEKLIRGIQIPRQSNFRNRIDRHPRFRGPVHPAHRAPHSRTECVLGRAALLGVAQGDQELQPGRH